MLGPLMQVNCMRQEGKHKPLKKWAKTCNNYKNITKTLASKHQESQAYSMSRMRNIDSSAIDIYNQHVVKISELENEDELCHLLDCCRETEIIVLYYFVAQ